MNEYSLSEHRSEDMNSPAVPLCASSEDVLRWWIGQKFRGIISSDFGHAFDMKAGIEMLQLMIDNQDHTGDSLNCALMSHMCQLAGKLGDIPILEWCLGINFSEKYANLTANITMGDLDVCGLIDERDVPIAQKNTAQIMDKIIMHGHVHILDWLSNRRDLRDKWYVYNSYSDVITFQDRKDTGLIRRACWVSSDGPIIKFDT